MTSLACTALRPASRWAAVSSTGPLRVAASTASRIPLSSNVSRIAAARNSALSPWASGSSSSTWLLSWKAERLPPGKTWAEGKTLDV